jgi:hypothetical protein
MMISGPCGTDAFPRPIGVGALPLNRFEPAWGELAILELLPCNSPCVGRSAALIGDAIVARRNAFLKDENAAVSSD